MLFYPPSLKGTYLGMITTGPGETGIPNLSATDQGVSSLKAGKAIGLLLINILVMVSGPCCSIAKTQVSSPNLVPGGAETTKRD